MMDRQTLIITGVLLMLVVILLFAIGLGLSIDWH